MKCKSSEIVNPITGRCVKRDGAIGKKILENTNKKCKAGEIVNPTTGRCVKRDGAIGKKILESKKKSPRSKRRKSPSPIRTRGPTPMRERTPPHPWWQTPLKDWWKSFNETPRKSPSPQRGDPNVSECKQLMQQHGIHDRKGVVRLMAEIQREMNNGDNSRMQLFTFLNNCKERKIF